MPADPSIPATVDTLSIRPWPDPAIDAIGHDPRSTYVETFWLGILGPSTTWLLRLIASKLDAAPEGFELSLAETARRLGLGEKAGKHSPFMRAIARCVRFELAEFHAPATLLVRRRVPPLSRRHVVRLPELLQSAHQRWQEHELKTPPVERMRRRSRQLALSMAELGVDRDEAERQLAQWRFHPAICFEAVEWAWERHAAAAARAEPEGRPLATASR